MLVKWSSKVAVRYQDRSRARNARRFHEKWPGKSVSTCPDKSVTIFQNRWRNSSAQKFQGLPLKTPKQCIIYIIVAERIVIKFRVSNVIR